MPCEDVSGSVKPGKGCYCKRGMEWNSDQTQCVERVADKASALRVGIYVLAAALVNVMI